MTAGNKKCRKTGKIWRGKGFYMKKKIIIISFILAAALCAAGCASLRRSITDIKSDISGGLQRKITVYTATGDVIATYEGKIDLKPDTGSCVKFDYDGKRYIYYNCFVESIADL